MRLLFVNYEFPPLGGGGGRANAHIAHQMATLGHEVVVVTSAYQDLPRKEIKDGYLILRIPTIRRHLEKCRIFEMVIFMFSSIFHSIRWVRNWRPDVTIAFFTLPSAPAALVLKKLFRIPYIVSLRGGDVPGFMKEQLKIYHWATLRLIRYLWKEADSVVANSQGLKDLALKSSHDLGITIIPNGVDSSFFQVDKKIPAISEPFRILTVGRLTGQKRLDTLLDAFAELHSKKWPRPLQLWVVGDGPLRGDLEKQASTLGISREVSFFGWQNQEQVKHFYSSSDLFVLSSAYEGMPNVILEAMAAGLAVVATAISGTEEIVCHGENGYLVPPLHPHLLAEAIASLIREEKILKAMAVNARKIIARYDWKDIASHYLELCRNPH